ncbi:MAG: cyclic pyranopterin monophosphate synthase MoaC [Candidatus Hodarchaeales archaeon]|jgi:cyclic pyranopterin phosphate synthase
MAVDISQKQIVIREAIAEGYIKLKKSTIEKIKEQTIEKGNVFELAKAISVHAVKQTPNILIYCHPIPILSVKVKNEIIDNSIRLEVNVKTEAQTGCEMEALNGVTSGLLQIWDMTKMYEKDSNGQYPDTILNNVKVIKKIKTARSE